METNRTVCMKVPLVLPDEVSNHLIQLASDIDRCSWELGDTAVVLVDELSHIWSKSEVRRAIANSCGLAVETIRDREWVARHIPEGRRLYPLSFHQYKATLGAGDKWEELAQRAMGDDYGGKPAPVSVIRSWLNGEDRLVWEKRLDRMIELATLLSEDQDVPESIRTVCGYIIKWADDERVD